jgi:alcohol dehydrogenase (cytochrome c)
MVAGVYVIGGSSLRWRAQVVALVASGQIPDLGLMDALSMVRPSSGYWLESLPVTRNPYASISNTHAAPADIAAGAAVFRQDCAGCHGADGKGHERAPALVGRIQTHGDSDWALYRTIKYGVGGTAMPPHAWDPTKLWQTIAYVRSLANATGDPANAPAAIVANPVSAEELLDTAEPGEDWLTYSGSYSSTRHSKLTQINRDTIARLAPRWIYQFGGAGDDMEVSPLVRNGTLYATYVGGIVALDARSGSQIWERAIAVPPDVKLCCANVTRGLALMGDRLFLGTLDAHLIALSAQTGARIWDTPVVAEYRTGYSITAAPLAYRGLVVTGVSGGEYPTRGFIAAFDAQTGKERWRFWTIPGPGEPGHESWAGESWRTGGGGAWLTGSYDPKLDLVYWGVGNPSPDFNAASRRGDDLYTNSVVALRGTTGQKVWHFQFTPGDDHDWDSNQVPVIVDREAAPHELLFANRNGFFYVLDRESGRFISGTPFVHQTWTKGLTPAGRPIRDPAATPTPKGTIVSPSVTGGTHWWPPSYDPDQDLMFVPVVERAGLFFTTGRADPTPGEMYLAGATAGIPGQKHYSAIRAIHPANGSVAWEHRGAPTTATLHLGGLMSTRGGLVFASDDRLFYALDSSDGKLLWSFPTGARVAAAPITFTVAGTQYIAVAAGHSIIAFALVEASH